MPFPPQPDWLKPPTVQELQDNLDDAEEELSHLRRDIRRQEKRIKIAGEKLANAKAARQY